MVAAPSNPPTNSTPPSPPCAPPFTLPPALGAESRFSWPAAATVGFGAAVATWCVWFLVHTPAFRLEPAVSGPLLLAVHLGVIGLLCRMGPRGSRAMLGLAAGVIAAGVNLLLLGSKLGQPLETGEAAPGVTGLRPAALLVTAGFIGASGVLGLVGGLLAARLPERGGNGTGGEADGGLSASRRWLGRFATVTALSIVPLLFLGGLVTTMGAGLSVPDWPGTFGANMFLYPLRLMEDPRVYAEHTHRLFGTLAGLCVLTLAVMTWRIDPRGGVRWFAAGLLGLVIVQGVLGGGWVISRDWKGLAVVHGVLGQVVFGLAVCLAMLQHRRFAARPAGEGPVKVGVFAVLLGCLVMQLAFGAMYRHMRSEHALWSHIGFSLVVMGAAVAAGIVLMRAGREESPDAKLLRRAGATLHAVVTVQFVLGWAAWGVLMAGSGTGKADRVVPTAEELASTPLTVGWIEGAVRTLHQANGALLLAAAVGCAVLAVRVMPGVRAAAGRGVGTGAAEFGGVGKPA